MDNYEYASMMSSDNFEKTEKPKVSSEDSIKTQCTYSPNKHGCNCDKKHNDSSCTKCERGIEAERIDTKKGIMFYFKA